MDKTDVIRQYAMFLGEQPFYDVGQATIYFKRDGYCYVTEPSADFRQFEYACISDITDKADILKDVLMASRGLEALVVSRPPYASICAASGRDVIPSLDDMAEIIGRRVMAVPYTRRAVQRALRTTGAVMVTSGEPYVVTAGRTLYEACVALTVLEKSAEVNLKATVLGGRKPLSAVDCSVLRAVYKRSYSRAELIKNTRTDRTLSEKQAGEQLAEYGRRLLEDGLVQGTWGNLSIRLDQDYMLCTPSGIDYERLGPEDMVKVKISDLSYEGEQKPTSEKGLHAGIYTSRSDARAVIHTHSKNCSVFAAAEMPLQVEPKECRERIGELIRVAKYGRPGTRKLCKRTLAALGNSPGVLMAHHGMICCGSDLEDAYEICQQIEKAAKAAIDARLE